MSQNNDQGRPNPSQTWYDNGQVPQSKKFPFGASNGEEATGAENSGADQRGAEQGSTPPYGQVPVGGNGPQAPQAPQYGDPAQPNGPRTGNQQYGDQQYGDQQYGNPGQGQQHQGQQHQGQSQGGQYQENQFQPPQPKHQQPRQGSQPSGGQSYDGQPNAGQQYGNQPNGAQQYGNQPNDGQSYGSQPNAGQQYGNQPNGGQSYGSQPNGAPQYGNQPNGGQSYGNQPHGNPSQGADFGPGSSYSGSQPQSNSQGQGPYDVNNQDQQSQNNGEAVSSDSGSQQFQGILDPHTGEIHPVPDMEGLQDTDALLVVVSGPDSGSQILLDTDVVTVGRSPNADIFLDDVTVSRKHAEFIRTPSGFTLRDTGSLNGTYVGRQLIDSIELQNGADVQIGKFRMIFQQRPRS